MLYLRTFVSLYMIANLCMLGKFLDPQILLGERSGTFRDSGFAAFLLLYLFPFVYLSILGKAGLGEWWRSSDQYNFPLIALMAAFMLNSIVLNKISCKYLLYVFFLFFFIIDEN